MLIPRELTDVLCTWGFVCAAATAIDLLPHSVSRICSGQQVPGRSVGKHQGAVGKQQGALRTCAA